MAKKKENTEEAQEPIEKKDFNAESALKNIYKSFTKQFGDDSIQLFKSNEGHIDNVSDWILTNCPVIDYALGGKGFPVGRVSEIYGAPSSGKTALAMHILKTTIDRGGLAFMLDSEAAFSFDMAQKIGLDRTKLAYAKPKTLEDIWRHIEHVIEKVKNIAPGILTTIVVDSIAAATCESEDNEDIGKAEMGLRARINSKGLRKVVMDISNNNICLILVNQTRANIGVMFGDKTLVPGGTAIDFACSIKMSVEKGPVIVNNDKDKEPIGQIMRVKVTKNKLATPYLKAELELFFDRGIPKYSGVLKKLLDEKVITKSSGKLVFRDEKFNEEDFTTFIEAHPELLDFSKLAYYAQPEEKLDD